MHETLRKRLMRRLETLPEAQLYQVLDYIEFLESRYSRSIPEDAAGLQGFAERLEDGLRKRTMSPAALREAFQIMAAADRVIRSVSETGREILADFQLPPESPGAPAEKDPEGGAGEHTAPRTQGGEPRGSRG